MKKIENITKEEIIWGYEILNDAIEESLDKNSTEQIKDEYGNTVGSELIEGCLVYLHKAGMIDVFLNHGESGRNALFTASKSTFIKNLWKEPDEIHAYDRPSKREIPVPNLFEDDCLGNTHISVSFKFPDSKIGNFCRQMMMNLRKFCENDVAVINAVVFMQTYVTQEFSYGCMHVAIPFTFVDPWDGLPLIPWNVNDLVEDLLGNTDNNLLYDPFMRFGQNFLHSGEAYYYAQASEIEKLYSTMLLCGILGGDTEHITLDDCTKNWNPDICDTIIATPELGLEVQSEDGSKEPVGEWLLGKLYSSLKEKERIALTILPASILSSSSGKAIKLKHDLIESNFLDKVILLPSNLFPKTRVSTAIILLKSYRQENEPITLADFSHFVKDDGDEKPKLDIDLVNKAFLEGDPTCIQKVSLADFRSMEYDWYVPGYFSRNTDIQHGYERKRLKDFLEPADESDCSPEFGFENGMIEFETFSRNAFDGQKEYKIYNLNQEVESGFDEYVYESYYGDLFIILILGSWIGTYWYKNDKIPSIRLVQVPKPSRCYRIDEATIYPDYLKLLVHKAYEQIEDKSQDDSKLYEQVLNTEFVIPVSVESQKEAFEKEKLNYLIRQAHKLGFDEAIERMKRDYMAEIHLRKHDMKPILSQLYNQAKLISFYMNKIEGNEQMVAKICQKLEDMSASVSELRLHLKRLTDEDHFGNPEIKDPIALLQVFEGEYGNYSISLDIDHAALIGMKPSIKISPVDFSTLVNTIVDNAKTHAFVDPNKEYKMQILFSYDKNDGNYVIDFKNDGQPMPKGMDKFRYGIKGEKGASSKGTGLGGYRVKSIVNHYGGDYDVFCNRALKRPYTTIRIILPHYKAEENVRNIQNSMD